MSTLIQVLLLIPCIFSCITAAIYAYIAYQNYKRPKDEIWETTVRLLVAQKIFTDGDQFARVYEQLKFFKDNGCTCNGKHLLWLMEEAAQASAQSQAQGKEN